MSLDDLADYDHYDGPGYVEDLRGSGLLRSRWSGGPASQLTRLRRAAV
jgi:hypothetical protein